MSRSSAEERLPTSPPDVPPHHPYLLLVSHNRFKPGTVDLAYDLREIPNPPSALRKAHTGLSREIQEHLMSNTRYRYLVQVAEGEIRELMERKILEGVAADARGQAGVTVGIMCGSGHHRSVAFGEELSRRDWPDSWEIETCHRDVTEGLCGERRVDSARRRVLRSEEAALRGDRSIQCGGR